jgi:hypothetical protein
LKGLSPVTIKVACEAPQTSSLAANFRRVGQNRGDLRDLVASGDLIAVEKASFCKQLSLKGPQAASARAGFTCRGKHLAAMAAPAFRRNPPSGFRKFQRPEALKQDARATHGSNINAMRESCGKPRATSFWPIFLAATAGFFAARK